MNPGNIVEPESRKSRRERLMKPLDGIVVLDLTRLLPGAVATMMLANFGAEVIKVEEPECGDYARSMRPLIDGQGAYYWLTNSGKKSVAINLKHSEGKQVLSRLISSADVLIEGLRPGVMDRLGLGYEEVSRQNPRLIYAAITGYGQEGPRAAHAGHDINYVALGGVLDTLRMGGGLPGVQIADIAGSTHAVIGVLLALRSREKTGRG